MKTIILSFGLIFLLTGVSISQTNSVTLKSGGGAVISQHSSVQEAYNAITTPVTQAYIIEINASYDGTLETLPITFGLKTGTSAANTITLRPAAGNTGEVISGNSSSGILIIDDADYTIIDGRPGGIGTSPDLKIQNTATSGSNANTISLINGATYCVIRYVHVLNATQNTAGPRAIVLNTSASNITGNSFNKITYCKIEGGRSGIGNAGTAANPNDSTIISNCEIFDWGYAGIWFLSGAGTANIDSCKIYQTAGVNNTIVSGLIIATLADKTYNIRKNRIYDLQSTSTSTSTAIRGIYFAGPAAGSVLNIENNMVSITLDNLSAQTHTGIELLGSNAYTANVYFNTTRIGGIHTGGTSTATTSAGIRIGASALTLNMKNNICINARTGGSIPHIGFALISTAGTLNIDYNCYNTVDTIMGYRAYWGTSGYNDLAAYKTAANPNEQNTVFRNVTFASTTDLHLSGPSIGDVNLRGTPIAGITRDFDNDLRNTVYPYKGCDEGAIPLGASQSSLTAVDYNLYQNYPNPFNPSTTIKFSVAKEEFVTLKVYNILGKEVASLISTNLKPGIYEYNFNASALSSGVYFYKIVSGNFSKTKQMLLLK